MRSIKYTDNRLEMVVTCVNYADFLVETMPFNLPHIDRLVVVTSHEDTATQALCRKWSVECAITDAFTEKGDTFNKGHGINVGLGNLRQNGWILHLDADIVLPLTFRNMLDKVGLDRDILYGCERCNVTGYEQWTSIKAKFHTDPQFGYCYMMSTPETTPVGANVVHKQYGYAPIGFFQLWHSEYMHRYNLRYPDTEGSAEHMDVQWALRWPRRQRLLIPTFRVFHLETKNTSMGANWAGRTSDAFKCQKPPPPYYY
jgi:hypothetical protein